MALFSKLYLYKSERESGELSGSVGTLLRLYLDGYLLIIVYIRDFLMFLRIRV